MNKDQTWKSIFNILLENEQNLSFEIRYVLQEQIMDLIYKEQNND